MDKESLKQEIEELLKLYSKGDITSDGVVSKLYSFINNQLSDSSAFLDSLGIDEELLSEAKEFAKGKKNVSTSDLQKRFRIGYARASRIIDKLEEA